MGIEPVTSDSQGLHGTDLATQVLLQSHEKASGLTILQTLNFRLFQIERVCRRQFKIGWKMADSYTKG